MRLSRNIFLLLLADLALVVLAGWAAFWLRFNFEVPPEYARMALLATPWSIAGYTAALLMSRVYRQVWRYTGLPELRQLASSIVLGGVMTAALVLMQRIPDFPRSVLLLQPLLALLMLGAARAVDKAQKRAAAIYVQLNGENVPLPSFSSVLTLYSHGEAPAALLKRADEALSNAKQRGPAQAVLVLPPA